MYIIRFFFQCYVVFYLAIFQDVKHQRKTNADQFLTVVLLSDGNEVTQKGERDSSSGLLLSTAQ